ncbi:glycosyltransferase family 4 protein [Halorientalis pallida]|uniref:glycosyltransferase family 4 protein n=1 Tax=Halorientalis pallida TaxID=2479928 RepID=UPI003C7036AA
MAPPPDKSSGVGKYSEEIRQGLAKEEAVTMQYFPAEQLRPIAFAKHAIKAGQASEDVVHVQFDYVLFGRFTLMSWIFFPTLFLTSRVTGTDVFVTMHEVITPDLIRGRLSVLKSVYIKILNQVIVTTAMHIVFLSEFAERNFVASTGIEDYSQIPHGVPRSDPESRLDTARSAFGYDPDETVIAAPGYVSPRKGSDIFKSIAESMPDYQFLLAGGSPREKYDDFFNRIQRTAPPNLCMTGVLDDGEFKQSFVSADIAVLPYQEVYQNGIKNTVAQSGIFNQCVAHELPVVASDCPYFDDIESEWGCVRTFETVEEATSIIRELLNDDEERERVKESMQNFKNYNRIENVIHKHLDVYTTVREAT